MIEAASTTAAPTNQFVGAAGTTTATTNLFIGATGNTSRPYKLICRDSSVGAVGQTAPINDYEPPLKIDSVVVTLTHSKR